MTLFKARSLWVSLLIIFSFNFNGFCADYPSVMVDEIFISNPIDLVVSPTGDYVYFIGRYRLIKVSTSDNSVLSSVEDDELGIPLDNDFQAVDITPDGKTLVVLISPSYSTDYIAFVDTSDLTLYDVVDFNTRSSCDIAIVPDVKKAFIAKDNSFSATVIDLTTHMASSIWIGKNTDGVIANPNGKHVYFKSEEAEEINVVSTSNNEIVKTIKVDEVRDIAVSPNGKSIYVATIFFKMDLDSDYDYLLYELSASTFKIKEEIHTDWPLSMAVSPDNKYIYLLRDGFFSSFDDSMISVVSTSKGKIVDNIKNTSGPSPSRIAASIDGNYLYIIDASSGKINILGKGSGGSRDDDGNGKSDDNKASGGGGSSGGCFISNITLNKMDF